VEEDQDTAQDAAQDRVTIQEAARRLGIKEDAIRKRIQRRSMRHEKAKDGRVYVWVDATQDTERTSQDTYQDTTQGEHVDDLREQVSYLRRQLDEEREARRRADTIIAQLARANEEQARAIRELEAPSEPPTDDRESPETVEEEPESTEPHPATGEAQEGTEPPEQVSGWLAPVDKLPWWQYVLGVILICLAVYIVTVVEDAVPYAILNAILFAVAWVLPGAFGFWVGLRQRNPRFWLHIIPFGALLGVVGATTVVVSYVVQELLDDPSSFRWPLTGPLAEVLAVRLVLPAWLLYVSGALVGNARQRLRTGRVSGPIPASPIATTRRAAAQQPRKGLSPLQKEIIKEIVGWGGGIIAALITLIGTNISGGTGGP
jgi:hypothetical protein